MSDRLPPSKTELLIMIGFLNGSVASLVTQQAGKREFQRPVASAGHVAMSFGTISALCVLHAMFYLLSGIFHFFDTTEMA